MNYRIGDDKSPLEPKPYWLPPWIAVFPAVTWFILMNFYHGNYMRLYAFILIVIVAVSYGVAAARYAMYVRSRKAAARSKSSN